MDYRNTQGGSGMLCWFLSSQFVTLELFEVTNCDLKFGSEFNRHGKSKENIDHDPRADRAPNLPHSRSTSAPFARFGATLRGRGEGTEPSRRSESQPVSRGLYVPALQEKFEILKSQIVTSSWGGARRALPYAFTEQGVAMLSSVLRSKRAVQVNIGIMRAFVRLREALASHADLSERLESLEVRIDGQFSIVFEAIDQLREQPTKANRKIGFTIGTE